MMTACCCGLLGSGVSNAFEVVAVQKQADSSLILKDIVKREGPYRLITKGVGARMAYHSQQSMLMFLCIHYIGKVFKVDLTDIA